MRCQETFFHIVVFPSVTVRDLTRFCVASHRWGQRHFDNSQIVIRVGEGGGARQSGQSWGQDLGRKGQV